MPAATSLYRPFFTPDEIALLDATPPDDLRSEITLLRVFLARILQACQRQAEMTVALHAAVVDAFCHAAFSLAALLHAHRDPEPRPPGRVPRIFQRLFAALEPEPEPDPLLLLRPPASPPAEPHYRPIEFGDFSHEWPPA